MNYELAKELLDNGFPFVQWKGAGAVVYSDTRIDGYGNLITSGDGIVLPTLSELIDACGDRIYELTNLGRDDGGSAIWQAKDLRRENGGLWRMYRGATPEEAVARLWLALNKKP